MAGGKVQNELIPSLLSDLLQGRSATKRGVFPANFVEEIEDLKGKAPAPSRTTLADSGESSIALVPLSASAPAPAPAPAPARARAPSMTVANVAPPAPPVLKPKGARRNSMEMVRVADAARNRQKKKDPARQNRKKNGEFSFLFHILVYSSFFSCTFFFLLLPCFLIFLFLMPLIVLVS